MAPNFLWVKLEPHSLVMICIIALLQKGLLAVSQAATACWVPSAASAPTQIWMGSSALFSRWEVKSLGQQVQKEGYLLEHLGQVPMTSLS